MVYERKRNTYKEIEGIKRNQKKILELKNTVTETRNSLKGSKVNLSRQKKESANLEIGQWLLSLKNRKKRLK